MSDQPPSIKILVVIPTYNNQATLRDVVEQAREANPDVLVVNDGSTDGGPESTEGLDVHRVDHPQNLGKGAAILSAVHWAWDRGFTHIVTVDADGQHDPSEVGKFAERIKANPTAIVIGVRDMSSRHVPASSRFGRGFSNFWLKIACGASTPDSQSGFRAYPVNIVRQVRCGTRRYDFEIEVLVRSVWAGASLDKVDISVRYDDQRRLDSRFAPWRDNARISLLYARLVGRNLLPWPHKIVVEDETAGADRLSLKRPRRSLRILLTESTSPKDITFASMLGVLLGTLPFIACHSLVIVLFATRLKLNRLVALNISHLCAPPFVPALAVMVGYYMRNGRFLSDFSVQTLGREIHHRFVDYLVGSFVVAPVLAVIVGGIVLPLALAYRKLRRRRGADTHD